MSTIENLTDRDAWSDDDLTALLNAVRTEQQRRWTLDNAEAEAEKITVRYHYAVEAELPPLAEGEHRAWKHPLGAHDAYPRGAVVAHNGKVWESLHPANAWAPGTDARLWKDVTANPPAPEPVPTGPEFKAGEAVKAGDMRTYQGVAYRVVQAHTTAAHWAPPLVPALWTLA